METFIPCGKNRGEVQEATEISVGFYLGSRMKRAFGALIPDGKMPVIFERATGRFLREATNEDMQKWKEAWNKALEDVRRR